MLFFFPLLSTMNKIFSIKKQKDIISLRNSRNVQENSEFTVKILPSILCEYIIIIPKKYVHKSHDRNKIRRRIKEIIRALKIEKKIFIFIKKSIIGHSYEDIKSSLQKLITHFIK